MILLVFVVEEQGCNVRGEITLKYQHTLMSAKVKENKPTANPVGW